MFRSAALPMKAGLDASAPTLFQVTAGLARPGAAGQLHVAAHLHRHVPWGRLVNTGVTAGRQGLPRIGSQWFKALRQRPHPRLKRPRAPSTLAVAGRNPVSCQEEAGQDLWGCQPPLSGSLRAVALSMWLLPCVRVQGLNPQKLVMRKEAGHQLTSHSRVIHCPACSGLGRKPRAQRPDQTQAPTPIYTCRQSLQPSSQARPPTTQGHKLAVEAQPTELQAPPHARAPPSRVPTADTDVQL